MRGVTELRNRGRWQGDGQEEGVIAKYRSRCHAEPNEPCAMREEFRPTLCPRYDQPRAPDRETALRQALSGLCVEYQIKARPLIDELAKIAKPSPPYEIWDELSNLTPEMWERWKAGFTGATPENPASPSDGEA